MGISYGNGQVVRLPQKLGDHNSLLARNKILRFKNHKGKRQTDIRENVGGEELELNWQVNERLGEDSSG